MATSSSECQKPGCNESGNNRYTGKHGNSLSVCDRHYWQLVTGSKVPKFDTGIGTDPRPVDIDLGEPQVGGANIISGDTHYIGGAEPATSNRYSRTDL